VETENAGAVLRAIETIQSRFPEAFGGTGEHAGQKWVFVKRDRVVDALRTLRDEIPFEMLMDLTCVDYLNQGQPERFCVVYELYSLKHNEYFRVKSWVPEDDPEIDTASALWKSAPWAEREVWDMFGVSFRGHPDPRRILMPFDYPGHPLRKDYPLTGNGERQNFPRYVK
jgi:NADH-quinone oxidoreductase subunit C